MLDVLTEAAVETYTTVPAWALAFLVVGLAAVEVWWFTRRAATTEPIPFVACPGCRRAFIEADGGER